MEKPWHCSPKHNAHNKHKEEIHRGGIIISLIPNEELSETPIVVRSERCQTRVVSSSEEPCKVRSRCRAKLQACLTSKSQERGRHKLLLVSGEAVMEANRRVAGDLITL